MNSPRLTCRNRRTPIGTLLVTVSCLTLTPSGAWAQDGAGEVIDLSQFESGTTDEAPASAGGTPSPTVAAGPRTTLAAAAEPSVVAPSVPGSVALDQVVVTASGFEQNVADAPASISVIPREQLETGRFRDLTDALRSVQGVAVTGPANEEDIYIRGLPGAYTLILVDGVRQNTREARPNGASGYEQDFIPPLEAIERIEVLRGPASTLYGSEAVGGVINIITRKVPERLTGSVTLEGTAQEHDRYGHSGQARFYAGTPLVSDVLGLQVYGRGFKREEDRFYEGIGGEEEGDITSRLVWTPNDIHSVLLEGGVTSVETERTVGRTVVPDPRSSDQRRTYEREHGKLAYEGQYEWGSATASVQHEVGRRKIESADRLGRYIADLREPEIANTTVDAKVVTPFEFFGTQTLSTGGQYIAADLEDQNPGRRTGQTERFSVDQFSLFAENEWQMTETFALTGGLRYNHHEVYDDNWSPRLYGVWQPLDNWTFKGGVSTGYKAPEIRQIAEGYAYTTGGGGCFYGPASALPSRSSPCGVILANQDLDPETSVNYEVSALYDSYAGVRFGATAFWTEFEDKIQSDRVFDENGNFARWAEDPNYTLFSFYNVDEARIRGVELTAGWDPIDSVSLLANYTYTDSEQKTGDYAGFALARTPEHQANIRADWFTPVAGLSVYAAGFYYGEETNAGLRIGSAGEPVFRDGDIVARKYPDYFTADLGTTYEISQNVTVNAAVYNLFDKEIEPDNYAKVVEGRRFWASIKASF
ncbi:TonB-dependent receptor [Fulvimarina endophytica]|uniref:TonB-dependent receptor n=1 Tax=Fulvimarina endophytica TaxID=2293836 RepID=A0A371XAR9_9HYPH|nr:TonB-dependent receptor [Fulvimarina endophytica]RFC66134.1 TonB-dependent receptor [Fulvimarina endophytica]